MISSFGDIFKEDEIRYSNIDLLPQNNNAIVRDSKMVTGLLKLSYTLITLLINSLDDFYIKKNYKDFDPHVGDTACQIRSYAFILLTSNTNYEHNVSQRLIYLNEYLRTLEKVMESNFIYKNSSLTILDFFKKHKCLVHLEDKEIFLCKSYILTIFKKNLDKESYIDIDHLSNFFGISRKVSKKIIHKFQAYLSHFSCAFIERISKELNNSAYQNLFTQPFFDDDDRSVYPCYIYSKIIFEHMKKIRCPILFVIKSEANDSTETYKFWFDGINESNMMNINTSLLCIEPKVCLLISCTRTGDQHFSTNTFLDILNGFGAYSILLMNLAAHPQYSGGKLSHFADQLILETQNKSSLIKLQIEYEQIKKDAISHGFCRDNSSMLLIDHIFFDNITNYVETDKSLYLPSEDIQIYEQ